MMDGEEACREAGGMAGEKGSEEGKTQEAHGAKAGGANFFLERMLFFLTA